ncbi:MAG: HAD family hydrolase [bacterium]|nr:HAD family hydrolase [bacterium]
MRYIKCKAVIFDLDGTLLNTLDDLADANNEALSELGFPTHPVEDYKDYIGDGVRVLLERTLPEGSRDDDTVEEGVALMKQAYADCWDNKTTLYDGVTETLNELTRRGTRLAVLSNKPHDFTCMVVEEILSRWEFEEIVGVSESVPPKPDPTGMLSIIKRMKLRKKDFVYLGDTNTDMQTAKAANIFPLGALWGFRDAYELSQSGAKELLSRPGELLDTVNL